METTSYHLVLFSLIFLISLTKTRGNPRSQIIEIMCKKQVEYNISIYVPNFLRDMDNLGKQIEINGFGTSEVGTGLNKNYGLAQCHGDLSSLDCALCYAEARTDLPKCYPSAGGRIYFDGCFMRNENYSFYEEYTGPEDKSKCGNTSHKGPQFEQLVRQAVLDATTKAQGNGGYAKAVLSSSGDTKESAYVLANCWRSLDSNSCQACLENATALATGCLPLSEGRALKTGCFLRYSDTNFLNADSGSGSSRGKVIAIVVSVVSSVAVLVVGAVIGFFVRKHKKIQKRRRGPHEAMIAASPLYSSRLHFKYSVLEKATDGFSNANKLGQGGFGSVYKGVLADGRQIAVKRLYFNNRQRAADFLNEVNIISNVEHKNLVRLLGCTCFGPESLLVYEFLPNISLDRFLFDPYKAKALKWEIRFQIITGTAEGLVYLHKDCKIRIIHRDIKASNILLDSKFRAKIADFGLARSFQEDKSHISTVIAGTLGYMAPEYLAHGKLTEKADIFSFGVLLMEIVTGKSNNRSKACDDPESLVVYAWKNFLAGTIKNLIDPNLMLQNCKNIEIIEEEISRVVHVGLLCAQERASLRPSISDVLQMLLRKQEKLPSPTRPPFTNEKTMELYNVRSDSEQAPLSSLYPR